MISRCGVKELEGKSYRCFFELTLQVIGGKWKPIILYHLSQEKVLRFGALKKSMPGITQRMLTKQLRELEADRLVLREAYNEVPPRVEYSLTELGESLIPIFLEMKEWGIRYEQCVAGEVITGDGYESVEVSSSLADERG
ncbi:winged helix-turn-helix transcriptional regulator [Halodesulfovibrio marinisediminis]|uniref:Transcriptional regulator, HxlR family n=1 Tax=Halodesulfovibrio marinisediminis DSM 17456 TaxID=1121457 RepID=A0A1N6FL34_9BACT|nr:helix-turn-helix domain-containing protein [Halodesulfovibrio marinisediminis]SIN95989.1 transcriptional regulator, HxlR family [Halodesulfovibrio marinisediminis DSM 17456]